MARFNDKFRKARLDQSPYLFHFINGRDSNPCETMEKILDEEKLISEKGYICFSASPITAIRKFFEVKTNSTGNPLYFPYGLGFSRDVLVRDFSARNVIYTDGNEEIPDSLKWRTDNLNVDSYDFEYLREWRIKGREFNFSNFPKNDMIIIAPDSDTLNHLIVKFDMEFCPVIDYLNGEVYEDWDEKYTRAWKGIAVDKLGDCLDDYAVSGATVSQEIGEEMIDKIFSQESLYMTKNSENKQ